MRWPSAWVDPSLLGLLKGASINLLLLENSSGNLRSVAARARELDLKVCEVAALPPGISVIDGVWPGVKLTSAGAGDRAEAGPTRDPWVDSNGWRVRLATALHPNTQVWIDARPAEPRLFAESYVAGVCDAAACGGRWVISLDEKLAAGIAAQKQEALATWRKITDAANFFSSRDSWTDYVPQSVMGVVSDFSGENDFFSHELLNLVARTNQQYRAIPKAQLSRQALGSLRSVFYADAQAPAPDARKCLLAFVEKGGTLIAGPAWGVTIGASNKAEVHPRYDIAALGKGKVAVAKRAFDDPYLAAQDSVVLTSHRYDLVRLWNGGAVCSYLAESSVGKQGLLQLVFYASAPAGSPSVQVAGRYRAAKLYTLDRAESRNVEMVVQQDSVEVHLPPVGEYAAIELEP